MIQQNPTPSPKKLSQGVADSLKDLFGTRCRIQDSNDDGGAPAFRTSLTTSLAAWNAGWDPGEGVGQSTQFTPDPGGQLSRHPFVPPATFNCPQPLAQDAVVHRNYRCSKSHGRDLPALTLGKSRNEMIPESPLIAMCHDQFTITKGGHLTQKFVAGQGGFPVAHVVAKDQERRLHDGT